MQKIGDQVMETASHSAMLEAIFTSDSSYNGKFYTGVITTGIYCLPSCRAKKPKVENIIIFHTMDEAERYGLRPCKKCIPDIPMADWGGASPWFSLRVPSDFNFEACLLFFNRSPVEPLHHVTDSRLYKLLRINGNDVILEISAGTGATLDIRFLNIKPTKELKVATARHIIQWFDLSNDLLPFYAMAANDPLLRRAVAQYRGLRLIGIPDLFEAITWAITGQQINLPFAYTLKRRLVEKYGECYRYNDRSYWHYPSPHVLAKLPADGLVELGFTRMKSDFIIGVAKQIAQRELDGDNLLAESDDREIYKRLVGVRGIGDWTANYVLMRFRRSPSAFLASDVGLQNAIGAALGLSQKPSSDQICELTQTWKGWKAYSTFYLWMTLLPNGATERIAHQK